MPCTTEVRVTPHGIPSVVDFAKVSIWPRPPLVHADGGHQPSDLVPKPPLSRSRASTLPTITTHKPLPSLPLPVRSRSLKLFRKKIFVASTELESALRQLAVGRPVIHRHASRAPEPPNPAPRRLILFHHECSAS